ncbi:MAG: type III ribulose-bisphosphate carboxylase [Candidatus Micrarchaeia archaeon]|jgi:ribulose-bisphosphate carboxylase large chain
MNYADFVDIGFKAPKEWLLAEYRVEPASGTSLKDAAGGIAAESSVGTWTQLSTITDKRMREKAAHVYSMKEVGGGAAIIKIAYPPELFEGGNMPQVFSSIAGNIFGVSIIKNLRFLDFSMPPALVRSFAGPRHGIEGVRKLTDTAKNRRPLVGTIIKPKLGLDALEHSKVAYEAWMGGIDVVKDDENLSSMRFNNFEKRVRLTLAAKRKAEKETGEKKIYLANVTAETMEMLRRAKFVEKLGGEYVMVDLLTAGFAGVQSLRQMDSDLFIHAHRAMHAALDRSPKHGIAMKVLAKAARLVGVDQIHVGTAGVGKMEESVPEDVAIFKMLKGQKIAENDSLEMLSQDWGAMKPVLSVCSGGLHPATVGPLVKIFGADIVIQAGGGVHGHPNGTRPGAVAMRQAASAAVAGIPAAQYAKTHPELRLALEKWPSQTQSKRVQ